ncbi:MAG: hypothetical protein GX663_06205 [Clostridiales bacterium]|nr:hypothetical protein [Clostridiales bacterium]
MDNISKILEAIREDGQAEADKVFNEGRKRADAVKKLYGEEAHSEQEDIIRKAEKEADEITQRGISQAGIESRNIKLTARRQALEKAFGMAAEKLGQLSDDEKAGLYVRLIGKYGDTGKMTIVLNEKDKNAIGKKLIKRAEKEYGKEITLSERTGAFLGGVILLEDEVETNCTFEVILEDIKKETEADVAAMLFA